MDPISATVEEERLLGIVGHTGKSPIKAFKTVWGIAACCILAAAGLLSCSIPQIVVLEDPLSPKEHLELGLSYEQEGKIDLAERHYLRADEEGLSTAALHLGNLYFSMGSFSEAESWYRKAIRTMPDDPRAYNNLAWMFYLKNEHLQEAETLARTALNRAPVDRKSAYRDTLDKILLRLNESP